MKFKNNIHVGLFALLAVAGISSCSDDDENLSPVPVTVGTAGSEVDLGLPSGTKWADHNLGATNTQDYGNYYGFGEVTGNVQTLDNSDYMSWTAPSTKDLMEANKTTYDAVAKLDTIEVVTYPLEETLTNYFNSNLDSLTYLTTTRIKYINNYTDSISLAEAAVKTASTQKENSRNKMISSQSSADSLAFAQDSLALDSLSNLLASYQTSLKYYNETWLMENIPGLTNTLKQEDKDYVYQDLKNIIVAYNDTTFAWNGNNADFKACDICGTENDPAFKAWGAEWSLPSSDQIKELVSKCTWEISEVSGVKGYTVTGPNGNSIFLPFSGYRLGYEVVGAGDDAYYWSGNVDGKYEFPAAKDQLSGATGSTTSNDYPTTLFISNRTLSVDASYGAKTNLYYGISEGLTVRPVKK